MMRGILLKHKMRYPQMTVQDMVKLLYQSEFGGGHMITDEDESRQRINREFAARLSVGGAVSDNLAEAIGGGLYRVSLDVLRCGLSAERLNRMFVKTASEVHGCQEHFIAMLDELSQWLKEEQSEEQFAQSARYLQEYQTLGYPMISHSECYRERYYPAYRIVSERYVRCLEACCEIDQKRPLLVAIDGGSASGKTTMAASLAELYDCNLFHMDDFFLRPEQRTKERFAKPGGNVDYERFYETVLTPVLAGRTVSYQRFDCGTGQLGEVVWIAPKMINIVEGAYSQHPYFGSVYDLTYWLFVSPEEQKRRILERNGAEMLKRFVAEWIPLETAYFRSQGIDPIKSSCKTL